MKVKLGVLTTLLVITTLFVAPFSGVQRAAAYASTPTPELESSPTGVYIVQFRDPAVASYTGGLPGLAATNPQINGEKKLDVTAPAAVAYADYLNTKQAEFISAMQSTLGRDVEVVFQYINVLNGMAVRVDAAEAASLLALPGVKSIQPEEIYQPETDVTPEFLGATEVWAGNVGAGDGTQGEGVIFGIIDTGINHAHPSFADLGGDGYDHTNPWSSGTYVGWCVSNPSFCNDKLIGAYGLLSGTDDPEDLDGHGSHTASTAAGNYHVAEFTVGTTEITRTISGMAPHANLIAYQVCDDGGCYSASIIEAVDLAITNEVDVINYSIGPTGGAEPNPWSTYDDLAFLDATAAGIVVSTSAGNRGPNDATIAHSGPWNMASANSSISRIVANLLDIVGSSDLTGIAALQGDNNALVSEVSGEIAYDPANLTGCNAFGAGYFDGKIALIQRGGCTFDIKIDNATAADADAVVVFNSAMGGPSVMGSVTSPTPAVMISLEDGTAVKEYIDTNPGTQAVLNDEVGVVFNPEWEDYLNQSSSRGPSRYDFIKPDLSAPGTNILAAVAADGDPVQYAFYSGTSMASPHSAGAAGLLIALHPDWSPAEIKSALVSASTEGVGNHDPLDPATYWDTGSGRLQIDAAANVGLVFDETIANYQAANPGAGGDPSTLNQPSLVSHICGGSCTWTRTVTSVLAEAATYTVVVDAQDGLTIDITPSTFTIPAGGTQVLTFTANTGSLPLDVWVYGTVYLNTDATFPDGYAVTDQHLPVAVMPAEVPATISVEPDSITASQIVDTMWDYPLVISNLGTTDPLTWSIFEDDGGGPLAPTLVNWADDFDTYATDVSLHGQGGWKGWGNDSTYTAYTSDDQALSTPNSVAITSSSDLVHEYTGYTSGKWIYTAWQFIPTGSTGESYFILLNQYNDAGTTLNWSTQVNFNSDLNVVASEGESIDELPMIRNQWVEIRVEIDLDNDIQAFYYGGDLLYEVTWTDGVSGDGILNIAAVDLFGNTGSVIYYDNMSLVEDLSWTENFDSYATDSSLHGQGGWKGWGNDPTYTAYARDEQARSTPNSAEITPDSDLVREFDGYTTGVWTFTAWQYIPSSATGITYFILLNQYDDPGTDLNWSTQVAFDTDTNLVINEGISEGDLPIVYDQWVELRVDIDLDADTQTFYYDGELLFSGTWTDEMTGDGTLDIAAIDLFGNTGTQAYYDDLSLALFDEPVPMVCDAPSEISWVSVAPTSGTTDPLSSSTVDVTFDTTGLTVGETYTGTLCVTSNDIETPVVPVPVSVTVLADQPDIAVSPVDIDLALEAGESEDVTVTVMNEGTLDLQVTDITAVGDWPAWVTIPVTQTVITPGMSADLIFTVDATGLVEGTYNASFLIHSNDPDEATVQVDITLVVTVTEFVLFLPIVMKAP